MKQLNSEYSKLLLRYLKERKHYHLVEELFDEANTSSRTSFSIPWPTCFFSFTRKVREDIERPLLMLFLEDYFLRSIEEYGIRNAKEKYNEIIDKGGFVNHFNIYDESRAKHFRKIFRLRN